MKYSKIGLLQLIIISSIFLRILVALIIGEQVVDLPGTYDQLSYNKLALQVLHGNGFTVDEDWWPATKAGQPTAMWSYLYIYYLVFIYKLFGIHPLIARLVQAVIVGLLQPYLVYRIGTIAFSKKVGLLSAALTAIYAYFIYYSGSLMTESFYIIFVLGGLYQAMLIAKTTAEDEKKISTLHRVLRYGLFGLTLGGAVFLRQLILIFIPFLFLWIFWVKRKQKNPPLLTGLLLSILTIFLMILPFTIYNYIRFSRFVLLNTNSGYAFFWSNHPIYGTHFQPILPPEMGTYQSLIPEELRGLNEAALDQALLIRGLGFVINDPIRYLLLSASRIPVYFMFWPSKESSLISNLSRCFSFGILLPFMLYGIFYAISIPKKRSMVELLSSPLFLMILFAFIYSMIHLLSWAGVRYRLPVDSVLLIFAGLALVDLSQRIYSWRKKFYLVHSQIS